MPFICPILATVLDAVTLLRQGEFRCRGALSGMEYGPQSSKERHLMETFAAFTDVSAMSRTKSYIRGHFPSEMP